MTILSWKRKAFVAMPLGILFVAICTICAAYGASFRTGQLDFYNEKIVTPPISMLMFAGEGKRIGQIGFPCITFLMMCCALEYTRGLEREIRYLFAGDYYYSTPATNSSNNQNNTQHDLATIAATTADTLLQMLRWLQVTALVGFSCLAIVGIVPLQENISLVLTNQASITSDSILHQTCAGIFFVLSILHMGIWIRFVVRIGDVTKRRSTTGTLQTTTTTTTTTTSVYYYKNSPVSFGIKVVCFVLCFIPLPTAFILHPISPIRTRLQLSEADTAGITQYVLVACVASFFASYTCELHQMMIHKQKQEQLQPPQSRQKDTMKAD